MTGGSFRDYLIPIDKNNDNPKNAKTPPTSRHFLNLFVYFSKISAILLLANPSPYGLLALLIAW